MFDDFIKLGQDITIYWEGEELTDTLIEVILSDLQHVL